MLQSVDTQQFAIGIYQGSVRVGKVHFQIGIRAIRRRSRLYGRGA